MTLSAELLELLKALERSLMPVHYLVEHLDDIRVDDPPYKTPEDEREAEETTVKVQELVRMVVQAKQEPAYTMAPAVIEMLGELVEEPHLDEYFTVEALTNVPGTTARWAKLSNLGFAKSPGDKIARYLRQAVGCYLHGMYDASAVLCRAILEFALRERLGRVGEQAAEAKTELRFLIDACATTWKVISGPVHQKAHAIRIRGNDSIHGGAADDAKALAQLLDTRDVLVELYGTAKL